MTWIDRGILIFYTFLFLLACSHGYDRYQISLWTMP